MACPRCAEDLPEEADAYRVLNFYIRLQQVERFAMETNPVYMCPKAKGGCGHIFSPGDHSLLIQQLTPRQPNGRGRYDKSVDTEVEHA